MLDSPHRSLPRRAGSRSAGQPFGRRRWLSTGAAALLIGVVAGCASTSSAVGLSTPSSTPSAAPATTPPPTSSPAPATTTTTPPTTTPPPTTQSTAAAATHAADAPNGDAPTHESTTEHVGVSLCGAPANPYGYNFCGGGLIHSPASGVCSYFRCIDNFGNGKGYMVECRDGMYSMSGGRSGACSYHGGESRPVYS